MRRVSLLVVLIVVGGSLIALPRLATQSLGPPRLTWVATAYQHGVVGYRDPAGAISPDGRWIAYSEGRFLRVRPIDGGPGVEFPPGESQIRRLAWDAEGRVVFTDGVRGGGWARYDVTTGVREILSPKPPPFVEPACVETRDGRRRITLPCGGRMVPLDAALEPYGPFALSPDRATLYFAVPNTEGTVDLWSARASDGRAQRLTSFSRDTYAPSVARDGTVLFNVQSYRTVVAHALAGGGPTTALATFRSQTPSWDPTGSSIGMTYGTWRRLVDDAKYPDIAQEAGIIRVEPGKPAAAVAQVVDDSASEDQSLCWSPNGKWIAYHSHKEQSDDVWLRPAAGGAASRRITFFGRGAEAGWPRWSPDGRWIVVGARGALHVIGVDQETGATAGDVREVAVRGLDAHDGHAEWLSDSATLVVIATEGPGRHVIFTVPRDGGETRVVHRLASEHDNPGMAVSSDGRHIGFVAPAADGYFQIFRLPLGGGIPVQVTRDPSHKSQPAWSPDGRSIAFTVWSYEAQFWMMRP